MGRMDTCGGWMTGGDREDRGVAWRIQDEKHEGTQEKVKRHQVIYSMTSAGNQ